MLQKLVLILCWSICFVSVNYGAKKLTALLNMNDGILKMALGALKSPWLYVIILLYGLTAFLYMVLLNIMPLSVAGTIVLGLGVILITLTGGLFFKEQVCDFRHIAGAIIILTGIIIIQSGNA